MKLLMNEKMKVYVKFGEFHEDPVLIIEDKGKKERYNNWFRRIRILIWRVFNQQNRICNKRFNLDWWNIKRNGWPRQRRRNLGRKGQKIYIEWKIYAKIKWIRSIEMKTHATYHFCLYRTKMLEVGVSARVTLNSHSINRLTPCFPRFVLYYKFTRDFAYL